MKNLISTILLAIFPLVSYSQKSDLSVYNNEINKVKQEVKYFEIEKINDDGKDLSFALSQKSGDIAPGSSQKITVTYTPTQVGAFTSTQYEIRVVGGNVLKLVCSG